MQEAPKMSEDQLLKLVLDYARLRKWRAAHFRPALMRSGRWATPVQGDAVGFPDLILVGYGRIIAAELKSEKGHLTVQQSGWLDAFRYCGAEVYVWKPADWDDIQRILDPGRKNLRKTQEKKLGEDVAAMLQETGDGVEVANLTLPERTRLSYWVEKALGKKVSVRIVDEYTGPDESTLYTVSVAVRQAGTTTGTKGSGQD